ncbi:MAG: class I SAM-dependent methyltransferase [Flavobacteriales bacterium]|nr:class I SAM-dependent methyltransferase [Flavobacteriales bacterium]
MSLFRNWGIFIIILIIFSCKNKSKHEHHHGQANEHMHQKSFDELVKQFEDPQRDVWQKPDTVIKLLGDLKGKKIMDIGSGTGYFSFRLYNAGANVICGDVDDEFLTYIRKKIKEINADTNRISTRKLKYDNPVLQKEEVDRVIIVNTYHHIENRPRYFSKVFQGLTPDGKLIVIDFKKRELPEGPPVKMKLTEKEVENELKKAGFNTFQTDTTTLPYQYLIIAGK